MNPHPSSMEQMVRNNNGIGPTPGAQWEEDVCLCSNTLSYEVGVKCLKEPSSYSDKNR